MKNYSCGSYVSVESLELTIIGAKGNDMNNLAIGACVKNDKSHLYLLPVSSREKWKMHTLAQWIWRSSKDQELNYGSARITVTLSTRTLSTWTNHSLVIYLLSSLRTFLISAHVRSTREGNVFTLFVRPRGGGGGYPSPRFFPRSLIPGPFWGGVTPVPGVWSQVLSGGYFMVPGPFPGVWSQVLFGQGGYPSPRFFPSGALERIGVPPSWDWGIPPSPPRQNRRSEHLLRSG